MRDINLLFIFFFKNSLEKISCANIPAYGRYQRMLVL